ncbi:hypothetical protein FRB99_008675, partial [Tulasnella sp. 403]
MTLTNSWFSDAALLGIGSTIAWKLSGRFLRQFVFVPKYSFTADLPALGQERADGKLAGRAVVCGGSIAGLLAAAVCAHHFESVLVVEPEQWANQHGHELPEKRELRKTPEGHMVPVSLRTRIMQYKCLHYFLPPCYMVLQRLFPNLKEEEKHFGLQPSVVKTKLQLGGIYTEDPYTTNDINSGAPVTLILTRETFETLLRKLVRNSKSNIYIKTGTITGFKKAEDGSNTLRGVTVRTPDGKETFEPASLVVDSSGTPQLGYHKWLKNAGYPLPAEIRSEYDPYMRYTNYIWTIPSHLHSKLSIPGGFAPGVIYNQPPDQTTGERRAFYICIFDNNQLFITVGGWDVRQRPHTVEGLRLYARTLNGSEHIPKWVHDLIDFLEEFEDECQACYSDANVGELSWVQYHKATLPDNFVAIGDSYMKLNPIYGQGASLASIEATTLDGVLRELSATSSPPKISSRYFSKIHPRVSSLWDFTKANDYGFSTTRPGKGEDLGEGALLRQIGKGLIQLGREARSPLPGSSPAPTSAD